ncbi:MAG: L,D-transpeptidase family protein [Bacteroidota bacterium]
MRKLTPLFLILLGVGLFVLTRKKPPAKTSEKKISKRTVGSVVNEIEQEVTRRLSPHFTNAGLNDFPKEIVLVGLKEEQLLQVYAKTQNDIKFIKAYPFTANSGNLGPKLKEGDRQIPEGIYQIEYLNPNSSFYLSLKINYPNEFDKSKSQFANVSEMGGDIFIHGKAVTIGCIPIGDEAIEEVFLMAKKAFSHPIKVIISPRDFRKTAIYPNVASIDWEEELYRQIEEELNKVPLSNL